MSPRITPTHQLEAATPSTAMPGVSKKETKQVSFDPRVVVHKVNKKLYDKKSVLWYNSQELDNLLQAEIKDMMKCCREWSPHSAVVRNHKCHKHTRRGLDDSQLSIGYKLTHPVSTSDHVCRVIRTSHKQLQQHQCSANAQEDCYANKLRKVSLRGSKAKQRYALQLARRDYNDAYPEHSVSKWATLLGFRNQ